MGKDEVSLRMEMVMVAEKSDIDGQTFKESNIIEETGGALVMGMVRKSGAMIPSPTGDMEILAGDQLLVLGKQEQIEKLEKIAR